MAKKKEAGSYRVINGFNYPGPDGTEIRVDAGTVLNELPAEHAQAIIDLGCIEGLGPAAVEPVLDDLLGKQDDLTTGPLEQEEE